MLTHVQPQAEGPQVITSDHGEDGIIVLGTLEYSIKEALDLGYLSPVEGDPLSFTVAVLPRSSEAAHGLSTRRLRGRPHGH